MNADDLPELPPAEPTKRGRGRPRGSRTRMKTAAILERPMVQTPPGVYLNASTPAPRLDFKYADPETLAARNMSLIDHAQQALRHELGVGFQSNGKSVSPHDIQKILDLCAALDRAASGMLRVQKVVEELSKNLTPEQTLEKAILKIMGQDTATQRAIINRLEASLKRLQRKVRPQVATATDAIAELSK